MNQLLKPVSFFLILLWALNSMGQNAPWVSYPSANNTGYGVYHFRKAFNLNKVPEQLIIHVSADNRYNLFANGQRVCYGPAKGDLQTYKYDVIDIAPFLTAGKNQLAALVYNGGADKPLAFISAQTAFMLRTENEDFNELNTGNAWKVYKNPAYKVISYNEMIFKNRWFYGFYACGGGDEVFAEKYPWGWETADFDDRNWLDTEPLVFEKQAPWNLVPRNIAFMDNHIEYPACIRKIEGTDIQTGKWNGQSKLIIPANTKASFLVDFETFTMGYPELTVNNGKGSSIQIKYAEALYEKVNIKAHRDSVNGLSMFGVWDIFHTDGGFRIFRPLWKRAFRYVQFNVETKSKALEIVSFQNEYSGYPYPEMATFESNSDSLNEIFEISKRTLRMCSGETYYDTPFYEQLSYGGDNRPISAISTYNSTDDRLLREVLRLYPQSENKETGLFKSAYPSQFDFDMGGWSMAWIQTLRDYYFMRGDSAFVKQFQNKIEGVLEFYQQHLDERTGMIGTVSNQSFIDWSITQGSIPRSNEKKEIQQSALLTLYYAHTLDCAAELFRELGLKEKANHWQKVSNKIKVAVYTSCRDNEKQLFRDYADKEIYSQHTNIFAILCDVVPPSQQKDLLNRILSFDKFDEMASSYFSFFLFKAMQKTGQENLFLSHLDFWYNFLKRGHTTCGETGFASHDRSDCHAWSAHPAYFLLSSVGGIKPADLGFKTVKITPHLGNLTFLKADMPHPKGRIEVEYEKNRKGLKTKITLPPGMKGTFEFNGKTKILNEGKNNFNL
ncbi:Bacterial alpha-L-rhamnosidase [Maribellus comscasis]|uniref:Bacterial alpha-L-rhamnosidase n=1 Tax=Maribellus comscasis TaxID=2681766 RepID=A0A6I6JV59_9BACT|nr:alpha-L-rhamnosidase C-terminal domain-containing protein [Maribellus comscasis]QGY44032.1 Bacterial alpha-L-rhamnosidase [Maribellus comscasis]